MDHDDEQRNYEKDMFHDAIQEIRNDDKASSSEQQSQDLFCTLPQIKNVKAFKNPDNPSRQIIVTWDQPEGSGDFHYSAYLQADKKTGEQNINKSQTKACFEYLKSDTSYTAFVRTIGENSKSSELASSHPALTDKAVRTPGFDIEKQGKPTIEISSYDFNGPHLESRFAWKLPDLEAEKNNFKLLWVQAWIYETGSRYKEPVAVENNIRTETIILGFLKSYEFNVKSTYLDIDENKPITATSTQCLTTGIGNPSISNVRWEEHDILVDWSAATGATKHTLQLINEENKVIGDVVLVKLPTETFINMVQLTYGHSIEFVIEATGGGMHQKSRKKFLIGGNESVTNVVAKKKRISWREIIVSWEQPIITPQGYKLKLYKVKKDNKPKMFEEVNALEQTQLSHRFVKLKSNKTYICEVIPIYNGEPKIGSFSNQEVTDERVAPATETHNDFGKPERILHMENRGHNIALIIGLSWSKVNIGENHKITGYQVNVSHNYLTQYVKSDFHVKLQPISKQVDVNNLQSGQKYDVQFTTEYIDLDDPKKKIKAIKTYSFCTTPSKPHITKCELVNGVMILSWISIHGAKKYHLLIKDEHLLKNMVTDKIIPGSDNTVKIQTTEELSIGRTCMIKVKAFANNLNSESEWKAYLIGGNFVPRNVQAIRNSDNPKRSILVTFDAPKQGPAKEYKIEAEPMFGKRKTFLCSSNTVLVDYLRKGIKYTFHVFAKHEEEWSDGSISNPLETDRDDNPNPAVGFSDLTGSHFDLSRAKFTGYTTTVNVNKGDDFGKVRDLVLVPVRGKQPTKEELLKLSWKIPTFDNNAFDYKVEKYKVEIRKINSDQLLEFYSKFEKDLHEYCTDDKQLELGEIYNISVSTIYIDIDQDTEYISNASEKRMQTRPCQPTSVKCNVKTNKSGKEYLRIEWNAAKGPTYYTVEIYTDESEQMEPLFKHNVEKLTEWERIFDDEFGYGTSYHAVITSIGDEHKTNSIRTDQQTIAGVNYIFKVVAVHKKYQERKSGGCFSKIIQTNPTPTQVKNVQASPGHNPSTSVNICWDKVDAENEEESTKYRVNVISLDEKMSKDINVTDNWIIVDGLLPGTKYFIKVAGGNSKGFGKYSINTSFGTELGTPKNIDLLNNVTSPDTSLILQFSEAEGEPVNYLGAFNKWENQGRHKDFAFIDVQPGHTFNDLEPNTNYFAMILAVFENGKKGKAVKSKVWITAPSKPVIYKSGYCTDNKINSSKDLFLMWRSDTGCREHEIKIKHGDKVESQQIIKNITELRYSCMHEASQYTAQIRTKNISFGQWSDEAVIDLAPVKLKNLEVKLDQESNNILIQCKREAKDYLSYYCQALCSEKSSGEPILVPPNDDNDENIVKFEFIPILYAEKYSFKLWAVDVKDVTGESSLTTYVISRPVKGQITKVERDDKNPSTDIDITWNPLERCDEYEIQIKTIGEQKFETCARSTDTSYKYRCKNPGNIYVVCVRGIRESVRGDLSDKVTICLAPGQVELIEDRDAQAPVETVQVKWKELETKPDGYQIILFNEIKQEIASETETEFTHHVFEKLAKPGSLSYCTVAAYNTTGEGKSTKSQNYRIKWNIPDLLVIKPDENNPSRRANISWERPYGVTCFRLEIENNQSGTVITLHLEKTNYTFESGISGNSYTIRLYSGCNDRYDVKSVEAAMTMNPEPPSGIKAVANDFVRGIIVTFKDISVQQKSFKVSAKRLTRKVEEADIITVTTTQERAVLRNLLPGGSYEISVVSSMNENNKSIEVFLDEYIQTFPNKINNLRSHVENGFILFEWDPLEVTPDEYIVRLRVNNEYCSEESTKETEYKTHLLKGVHSYELEIAASNTAGKGKSTRLERFVEAPDKISNLRSLVENGFILFEWDSLEIPPDEYIVRLRVNNEYCSEESTKETKYKKHLLKGVHSYELEIAGSNTAGKGKTTRLESIVEAPDKINNLRSHVENGFILFEWDSLEIPPDEYIVRLKVNNEYCFEESTIETEFKKHLLKGVHSYELEIAGSNTAGKGKITRLERFVLVPENIQNLSSKVDNGAIIHEWDPVETMLDKYTVQWRVNNEPITEETTKEPKFEIRFLKPAQSYSLRVMASNIVGNGNMSQWNTFITNPLPPRNIKVTNNKKSPRTSCIVKFEDELNTLKKYKVSAFIVDENGDDVVKQSVTTEQFFAFINDLDEATDYYFKVQTIFCGKKSKEIMYINDF